MILLPIPVVMGTEGDFGSGHRISLVAQLVKNPPAMRENWVQSLGWSAPLKKGTVTYFSILESLT